jgi:hypothetical protein
MTATNHALTGATIGLLVGDAFLAVPVAFMSHFVLDAIPHYGSNGDQNFIKTTAFKRVLFVDALICLVIVSVIIGLKPHNWLLACVCAFLATSPDLLWINSFTKLNRGKKWQPSAYSKFAKVIQWFEKPIGAVVELSWAIAAIIVLSILIK